MIWQTTVVAEVTVEFILHNNILPTFLEDRLRSFYNETPSVK